MIQKNVSYKQVKVIESNNIDLQYAPEVINNRARSEEQAGWRRFGPITPIYDSKSGETIFVQVLTR